MEQKKIISIYRQFYTKFSNVIIKKLINFLQTAGKKTTAKKLLINCLNYVYKQTQKNPVFLLENYIKLSCRFILNYSYVFYYFTQMGDFKKNENLEILNKSSDMQSDIFNYNNELHSQYLKEIKKSNVEKLHQNVCFDTNMYTKPEKDTILNELNTLIHKKESLKMYKQIDSENTNYRTNTKFLKTKAFSLYSSRHNDVDLDKYYNTTNLSLINYYEFMKSKYSTIDDMNYSEFQPILLDSDFMALSSYGYDHELTYENNKNKIDESLSLDNYNADTAEFKKEQMFIRLKEGLQNQFTLPVIYSAKFLAFRKKIINSYLRMLIKDFTRSKKTPFYIQLGEEIIKGNCGYITMRETHFTKLEKLFDKTNIQTKLNDAVPYILGENLKKRRRDLNQIKLLSHIFGIEFAFSVKEIKFLTNEYPVLLYNATTDNNI